MSDQIAAGLAETIKALRAELTTAMESSEHEALRFQLGPVELEVTLAITREGGVDGGVRFGVVSFGAKGGLSDEATHRLSLSLQPVVGAGYGRSRPRRSAARRGASPLLVCRSIQRRLAIRTPVHPAVAAARDKQVVRRMPSHSSRPSTR